MLFRSANGHKGHHVGGVGGEGGAVRVHHLFGIAVVGGDEGAAAGVQHSGDHLIHSGIHSLNGLDSGIEHAGVADHVTVGKVQDDHVILAALDALDAFSCHGTGGIWGGLLTGVFSCTAINSSAGNGLVYGEFAQFGAQAAGIGITIVIAVVGTLICYGITRLLTGKIRVDLRDELMGLDVSQHGESAYPSFNGLDN